MEAGWRKSDVEVADIANVLAKVSPMGITVHESITPSKWCTMVFAWNKYFGHIHVSVIGKRRRKGRKNRSINADRIIPTSWKA